MTSFSKEELIQIIEALKHENKKLIELLTELKGGN